MPGHNEMRTAAHYVADWHPSEDWAEMVAYGLDLILHDESADQTGAGLQQLVMMLGDSGAPELCLLVCLRARLVQDVPQGESQLDGHIDICLMALDLARPADGNDIYAIDDLGEPDEFIRDEGGLKAWLGEQLEPFDGSLRKAAEFSVRLAAIKVGLLTGPREYSVADVLDEELWSGVDGLGSFRL